MQNDSIITKIKVLAISIVIVVFVIIAYCLDKELAWGLEKVLSCILISIYAFFLPPTIKYITNWFKNLSVEEAFYEGFRIGYRGLFVLIIIDPFVGAMYYFNKKFIKNNNGGNNIVMVGWYLM